MKGICISSAGRPGTVHLPYLLHEYENYKSDHEEVWALQYPICIDYAICGYMLRNRENRSKNGRMTDEVNFNGCIEYKAFVRGSLSFVI